MVGSWRSLRAPAPSLRRYGGRSTTETTAAGSQAAGAGTSHPSLGPRGPHHALESRLALSPPPPRGSRGGLPARSPARRRASVPPPGRAAYAGGAASSGGVRRSRQDPTSTARCRGARPERADHHPGVAGGAPGRGLGNRRLASLGALDAGRRLWDTELAPPVDGVTPRRDEQRDAIVRRRVGDRKARRDLVDERRVGDGRAHGLEIRAHVERELVAARLQLARGGGRGVGAAVRGGGDWV